MDDRAVTTCMYFTEDCNAEEKTQEKARSKEAPYGAIDHPERGQEDWMRTRTPSEMQGQWRSLDCDKNCRSVSVNSPVGEE